MHETSATVRKPLDPQYLELLACPACDDHPPLRLAETEEELVCGQCGLGYAVSPEGEPDLVAEHARMTLPDRPEPAGS